MTDILTGLRIGGCILWAWILWRILFESWHITEAPDEVRRRGWIHFRRFLALMGFAVVFLFSPENILRVGGYITEEQGFYMLGLGSLIVLVCGILIHHGLDIVGKRPPSTVAIYFVIALLSIVYSVAR